MCPALVQGSIASFQSTLHTSFPSLKCTLRCCEENKLIFPLSVLSCSQLCIVVGRRESDHIKLTAAIPKVELECAAPLKVPLQVHSICDLVHALRTCVWTCAPVGYRFLNGVRQHSYAALCCRSCSHSADRNQYFDLLKLKLQTRRYLAHYFNSSKTRAAWLHLYYATSVCARTIRTQFRHYLQ